MGSSQSELPARPDAVPLEERYSVRFLGFSRSPNDQGNRHQEVFYSFGVVAPARDAAPGHVIERSFEEFQHLATAIGERYGRNAPELPADTIFTYTDDAFLSIRAAALEYYLNAVLTLEPLPRLKVLRRFLDVWQPLALQSSRVEELGTLRCGAFRLPVPLAASIIRHGEPLWVLHTCSAVCRGMHEASRHPRCWPTVTFRAPCAEKSFDRFCGLLLPTCQSLQALHLDLTFQSPRLASALPAGVSLPQLRRLVMRLGDSESTELGVQLLECVESPHLHRLTVETSGFTEVLLRALMAVVLAASAALAHLDLLWLPSMLMDRLIIDESISLSLLDLLSAARHVEDLSIGISPLWRGKGLARSFLPLTPPHVSLPGTHPILSDMTALPSLRRLTFDLLSDVVLACLERVDDQTLQLQRLHVTGASMTIQDANQAFVTLLAKTGSELEDFRLQVEVPAEVRDFMMEDMGTRIGALPNLFAPHSSLKSLAVNCVAFDDAGLQCIAEHCPDLHTLILDKSAYWTDDGIVALLETAHALQRFRMRQSTMLSDRSLYALVQVAHQFVTLELERSYGMSSFAIEQLKQSLNASSQDDDWAFSLGLPDLNVAAVRWMEAMSPEPVGGVPPAPMPGVHPSQQRSSSQTLTLLPSSCDGERQNGIGGGLLDMGSSFSIRSGGDMGFRDVSRLHIGW